MNTETEILQNKVENLIINNKKEVVESLRIIENNAKNINDYIVPSDKIIFNSNGNLYMNLLNEKLGIQQLGLDQNLPDFRFFGLRTG